MGFCSTPDRGITTIFKVKHSVLDISFSMNMVLVNSISHGGWCLTVKTEGLEFVNAYSV